MEASIKAVFPKSCVDASQEESVTRSLIANGYNHPFATELYNMTQESVFCLRACQEKLLELEGVLRDQDRQLGSKLYGSQPAKCLKKIYC